MNGCAYGEFLASKVASVPPTGFQVHGPSLNRQLFDWQKDLVSWAVRKGRAAYFLDCGLGKTPLQLEWARHIHNKAGDVLILAPLGVRAQTVREGKKFGIPVTDCKSQDDVRRGINVTNYERLHLFDPSRFAGVVLDESSILKSFMGKTKRQILELFERTPYKLACTATPAPNDHLELGNHCDFLNVMPSNEMIMRWFINDTMSAGSYRLKGHAARDYWQWVASWAVSMGQPSDLGYTDDRFTLPPLNIETHIVEVDHREAEGALFRCANLNATTMHREMRKTAQDRAETIATIIGNSTEVWAIWCNTNYEADALRAVLPDAEEVRGSEPSDAKERKLMEFAAGNIQRLITKPAIAGFGMNWQHCYNMAFVGLSYSYEQLYQALRRSWRFGQEHQVNAHVICAESETGVLEEIMRKQRDHEGMKKSMADACRETIDLRGARGIRVEVEEDFVSGEKWEMHLGDSCRTLSKLPDESVHFSIYSPPFANLYIYSDSIADMGNSSDVKEFFEHYKFVIREQLRVTKPGRLCAVHCKDLPLYKGRDGAAGLLDFPGAIIAAFSDCGWTFHSRVTIWKDPVIEMQRTKNHGLLYKNLCQDSSVSRQGMADYLIMFRKWDGLGDTTAFSPEPVSNGKERFDLGSYVGNEPPTQWDDPRHYSIQVWQRYASPVWFDIRQTNVLNGSVAREAEDEKHICPLQLDVIERAIQLWTNPGETVMSPFAGIGSEGYMAVKMGRRFIGIELKRSYFDWACRYLKDAEAETRSLFEEALP